MSLLNDTIRGIDRIREQSDTAMLFCSWGKDSLVLLDLLYPRFDKVICVFMYFVPGLEHIEKYIRWAKAKYPGIEIDQIPHWNLTYILQSGMFCVANPKVKLLNLADIDSAMRLKHNTGYAFYGMKKADSLNRRLMLGTYENYENKGKVYPLADWKQGDVLTYMKHHKLPQPVRYSKKASGGVCFDIDCFLWMRENYPEDLQKVLKVFPASEKILYEHDIKHQNGKAS
ncbi:MAG: phosphoadenosine phosphosulfate reductase family protein [Tannerellaceae bacterium]|jgi:sulfate adenylyltransferase subunit 2|nr:phosphoadenosine phosphosulfate reductase family protein [Tannerellaceae bacterium]